MIGAKWLQKLNQEEQAQFYFLEGKGHFKHYLEGGHIWCGPGTMDTLYMEEVTELANGNTLTFSFGHSHSGPKPSWVKQ